MNNYITPELRENVRSLMRTSRAVPASAEHSDQAEIINRLIPVLADAIPDADIDAVILELWESDPAVWG